MSFRIRSPARIGKEGLRITGEQKLLALLMALHHNQLDARREPFWGRERFYAREVRDEYRAAEGSVVQRGGNRMSTEPEFRVVWPMGHHVRTASSTATEARGKPRGALDLNSAKVAFVWTYNRKGDQMFSIMRNFLSNEYPDISFIGHEVFGNIHGASETEVVAALPELLRQHKADVAVIGIGG